MRLITVLAVLITFQVALAGEKIKEDKVGIHGQLMGITTFGLYFDYKVTDRVYFDFAFGQYADMQLGFCFSFFKRTKRIFWYPYFGAQIAYIKNSAKIKDIAESTYSLYQPLGLRFLSTDNYSFAFEVGYNLPGEDLGQNNTQSFLPAIRFGMYF